MGVFSGYLNDACTLLVGNVPKRNPVESELSIACGDQSSQSIQECCFTNSRRANDCDAATGDNIKIEVFNQERAIGPSDRQVTRLKIGVVRRIFGKRSLRDLRGRGGRCVRADKFADPQCRLSATDELRHGRVHLRRGLERRQGSEGNDRESNRAEDLSLNGWNSNEERPDDCQSHRCAIDELSPSRGAGGPSSR